MPDGDLAVRVASARAFLRLDERLLRRLLRDLALIEHGQEAPRGGIRIECFQCHCNKPFSRGTLRRPQPASPAILMNNHGRAPPKPRAKLPLSLNQPTRTRKSYKLSAYSIIFSPAASFTYAFFQSLRCPSARPRRRNLP